MGAHCLLVDLCTKAYLLTKQMFPLSEKKTYYQILMLF